MRSRRFEEPGTGYLRPGADLRRRTVRFRITALATAVVALSLVAAAFALLVLQRNSLTSSLDSTLKQRADDIMSLVDEAVTPEAFPGTINEGFVQLVAADGTVIAATPNLAEEPALSVAVEVSRGDFIQNVEGLPVDDDEFRMLSRATEDAGVLHVGTTYDAVIESVSSLAASMSVIVPILVISFGALIWWMVGRTLQPVEAIRREVSEIGASELHRRVPRPGTEDEIDRLAGTMNEMLQRVEASTERQQRFVADASHELRSPLTRLRTQLEVELADRGQGDGVLAELLGEILGMQHLVEDLLYLAKADAGSAFATFERVDLDDLVMREAKRIGARGRVDLDLKHVSGAHVMGDPGQLSRLIRNLVENAERHASSTVTLRLFESGELAHFLVSDDGVGIAPEHADRVFERFGRLDDSRNPDSGGAGLGLAIARHIAQSHSGRLELVTAPEAGATFELTVPLAG